MKKKYVVSFLTTTRWFYLKAFPSDRRTASALQGEFILFCFLYLICLSDSFALSDSQQVQGDGKLPDQWRRHAAGRKWDTAQWCKLCAANRERRLLLHAYEACQLSFCSPVFQRGRRSMAARTVSTFRKEKPDSNAESHLTPPIKTPNAQPAGNKDFPGTLNSNCQL